MLFRSDVRVIEDGLRALRWARIICSTGFAPHPSGFSVTSNPVVQNRIKNLSGERVRDEFLGILSTERPAMGMTLLQDLGILEVWFPELEALVGLEQNIWHSEDVWGHTLMALHYAALLGGDLTDRVTAVFHDVGKGVTQHVKSKGLHSDDDVERQLREYGYSFHDHDSEGIRVLDASTIPRLKLYGSTDKYEVDMERVKHLINGHMHVFSSDKIRRGKRLKFLGVSDFGIDMLERSFILFLADTLARNLWLDYPLGRDEAEPMWGVVERGAQIRQDVLRYLNNTDAAPSVKDVNLSGHDVMALLSIKPSPTVGVVLRHLFYLVTNEDIANDKDALSDYVTRNKELLLNLQEEK